jgi:hypothetical protein
MAFEVLLVLVLVAVVLGFVGKHIYNNGVKNGRMLGAAEEAARWKQTKEWNVMKAEKHV